MTITSERIGKVECVMEVGKSFSDLKHTVFTYCNIIDLITAHAPLNALSSDLVCFRLQPVYFYRLP